MKLRYTLTKILLPFIKLINKLGKPEPRRTQEDVDFITKIIKPGDVLLSREDYRLSNLFIKGFYGHAAIYVGDSELKPLQINGVEIPTMPGQVLEAVPPLVRKVSLQEFILSVDSICVVRPLFDFKFSDYSSVYVGHTYDFEFISGNENWYCSELVYDYLLSCAPNMPFKPRISWGVSTVTPEDFYLANDKFQQLYEVR